MLFKNVMLDLTNLAVPQFSESAIYFILFSKTSFSAMVQYIAHTNHEAARMTNEISKFKF